MTTLAILATATVLIVVKLIVPSLVVACVALRVRGRS